MPIIPLPTRSAPLPDAPAPVLDRERRPTVDNRGLSQAVGDLAKAGRMPELPGSLAAPSGALVSVGKAIAQAGGVLEAVALKEQEARSDWQVSEASKAFSEHKLQYEDWRAQNPDPADWLSRKQQDLTALQQRLLSNEKLTPAAKERIGLMFNQQIPNELLTVQKEARVKTFDLAKSGYLAQMAVATESQDQAGYEAAKVTAREKGYLPPHEEVYYDQNFKKTGERLQKQAEADAFDRAQNGALTLMAARGTDSAIAEIDKEALGPLDATAKERLRGIVRQAGHQRSAEAMDMLASGIVSGTINSEARLDEVIGTNPHITPVLREKMVEELKRQDVQAEADDRRVNGVKNSVEMFQKAQDYDRSKDPDGSQYFALIAESRRRVDADSDRMILGLLNQKFGAKPVELKPQEAVMKNLRETLADFYNPETGKIPWRRKEWQEVPVGDPAKKKTKWEEVEVEDENKKRQALDAQTRVLTELDRRAKLNPEKFQDIDSVKSEFLKLLPEGMAAGMLQKMQERIAPRSVARGMVTSYGYANDSTPDSNSKAGIGAWVPDSEAEKIKRGEASPYKLREGDIAVSPDVEKAFRVSGVKPGDEVLVQLANGEVQRVRWMDRTAQDEDILAGKVKGVNRPLRGRFDFFSPSGKHRNDGVQVVKWWVPEKMPSIPASNMTAKH